MQQPSNGTNQKSGDDGKVADVFVRMGHRQFYNDSQVTFNVPKSKLIREAIAPESSCRSRQHMKVRYNYTVDLCKERRSPCQQLCDVKTGECSCMSGYVRDEALPEKCRGEEYEKLTGCEGRATSKSTSPTIRFDGSKVKHHHFSIFIFYF